VRPDGGDGEQPLHGLRDRAVTVGELGADGGDVVGPRGGRDLGVGLKAKALVRDVLVGDVRVDGQLDADLGLLRLLLAAEVGHGLGDHADVQVEAHTLDVAGLLPAEQVAGAADLEVLERHLDAGTQVGVGRDGLEAVVGGLGERAVRGIEEVGVGAFTAPAHTPAQLVQLGQAHELRALHDERVGVGDVESRLHDRGADQHVGLAVPEVHDHALELVLVHLPVRDGDPRLRHELRQPGGGRVDGADAVVDEEHLAVAEQLAPDRGRHLLLLVRAHVGEHRVAFLRGRGEGGHLPDARDGHLERARDGGGGHRENIHVGAELLEGLLVLHAEALLLVHDHQAQVPEVHLPGDEAVGADHHVHGPGSQPFLDLLRLLVRLEAREGLHHDREAGVALGEGLEVLLHQEGGGDEHGHLLPVLHGLEGGTHRDLGLAVADVAGDEAVHGSGLLHVRLHLVDGDELVRGLGVGEGVLQFALPRGVRREGMALRGHPGGVQADQLAGDLADGLAGAGAGLRPVAAAELVEGRGVAAGVLRHLVEGVGGDVEQVPAAVRAALGGGVLDDEVLAGGGVRTPADRALHQFGEPADSVLLVDHVVAGLEGERVHHVAAARGHLPHVPGGRAGAAGDVGLGEDGELQGLRDEPAAGSRGGDLDDAGGRRRRHIGHRGGGDVGGRQLFGHATAGAGTLSGEDDPPAVPREGAHVPQGGLDVAAVGADVAGADADGPGDVVDAVRVRVHELDEFRVRGQGGEGPPAEAAGEREGAGLGEFGEGGVVQADRDVAAGRGRRPGGSEELGGGGDEVLGAAADALGVGEHHEGVRRDEVEDGLHAVHQGGGEGLHALHGDAVGDAVQHVGGAGERADEGAGAGAHGVGEEQLAGGWRPEAVHGVHGALVGHGEGADLVHGVPEELHAERVRLGGREDVEEAATDGELAAALHHVHAGVGGVGKAALDVPHVRLIPGAERDRGEPAEALRDGLEEGADGHQDHPGGVGLRGGGVRVGEAAEDGEAAGDRVRARGEPLVGQGLPGREDGDGVLGEVGAQGGLGLLGLAGGGRDEDDRPLLRGACHEGRAHTGWGGDVEHAAGGNVLERGAEPRVLVENGEEAGQVHGSSLVGHSTAAPNPAEDGVPGQSR